MRPIHIIGGGLAGLTLGIALRQRGVPVRITEAGSYPRHRVCGEFICGRGLEVLSRLQLGPKLQARGARAASTAAFFLESRCLGRVNLPEQALCISRYDLDSLLAEEFQTVGGELTTKQTIRAASANNPATGTVWATGRRAQPTDAAGWRWFGLKMHMGEVALEAGLEMHLSRNSYVGLCQVSTGEVNVCGLFRRQAGQAIDPAAALRGEPGTALHARLRAAVADEASFCSVAGLSLHPQPIDVAECRVGDALTMIPPITGNGMSMAFESANIAAGLLYEYATAERDWVSTTNQIATRLHYTFRRRLRMAGMLHDALFSQTTLSVVGPVLFQVPGLWRMAFNATR